MKLQVHKLQITINYKRTELIECTGRAVENKFETLHRERMKREHV